MDMGEPLRIGVVFNFVCPWCYIGKRRLEGAHEVKVLLEAMELATTTEAASVVA